MQYNRESAWLISHSLSGSQIPKQARKKNITWGKNSPVLSQEDVTTLQTNITLSASPRGRGWCLLPHAAAPYFSG